jgi:CelD/BcsL family acetyltransferase involved in cellulose biosynthesis
MRNGVSDDVVLLEEIERLEDVREEWIRLAEGAGHPFATWEWNATWWRWFGAGRPLYSFRCRDRGGEVVAILPLYVAAARPVRVARFLGYGNLQSPVCAPAHMELAARALRQSTEPRPGGCRLLMAERLPGDQGWGSLLGGKLLATGHDPVLRFRGMTWEDYLASRSRNFREQLRRRERRLVKEHGLTFRLADDVERLPADMDALFRLHRARWGTETTGVFDGNGGSFHREFALAALRRGWLRLWLAEVDGEPVASWYGWRFAGAEWYYQAGRDPRFERLSLGTVLLTHTVREACRDGADAYHFMGGTSEERYKQRFTEEDAGTESRLLGSGALAQAGGLAIAIGRSLPGSARKRVKRIAG